MKVYIENIKKYYQDRLVLDVDKLELKSGKITGVLGPNGSGKSTLMTIIAGLNTPASGFVKYNNLNYVNLSDKITYLSHNSYLFNDSVFNNISYPLKFRKYNKKNIEIIVGNLLEKFNIEYLRQKNALKLSGGEKQKVCLARALSFQPELLLIDEPTSNIDPGFIKLIEKTLINENKTNNMTILLVTHNTGQAFRICDDAVFLNNGKILEYNSIENLRNSNNEIIKDFIELN